MLGFVRAFPMIASLLLPLAGGLVLGGLQEMRFQWVVLPRELAVQRAELVAEYEKRVAEAVAAEQLRQFKIIERMTAEWQAQLELELADHAAKIDLLEEEIGAYEDAKGDDACRLDEGDLDFLLGAAAARGLQHDRATSR